MTWNPLDWTAEPFLILYLSLAALVFVPGFIFKSMIGPGRTIHQLSVLELAYLAGGANRLGDAVLLGLISVNGATIAPKKHRITVTDQTSLVSVMDHPPVLKVKPEMTRQQFQTAVKPLVEHVQRRLQELGYYPASKQVIAFRVTVLPFVGALLVWGVSRAFLGVERHHPIGILVFLIIITAVAGLQLAAHPARTRAGKQALEAYKVSNERASRAPLDHELPLAVALSGAAVLSGTAYAPVYAASRTMNNGGGGDGGGGDGGGGGCGGCGG